MRGIIIERVRLYEGPAGQTIGPRYFKDQSGKPFMGCPVVESKDKRFPKYIEMGCIIPTDSQEDEIILPLDPKTLKPTVSLTGGKLENGKVKGEIAKTKAKKASAGGNQSDGEAGSN